MCFFVTSNPCIIILVIRADLFYVKQCRIPETSPRSLGWYTGRSGFSKPGCHKQDDTDRTIQAWHDHMNMIILACNMVTFSCTNLLCTGYVVTTTCITYHHGHHTIILGSNQAWYYNTVVIIHDHKELDFYPSPSHNTTNAVSSIRR